MRTENARNPQDGNEFHGGIRILRIEEYEFSGGD
jgi:hypothetical protein